MGGCVETEDKVAVVVEVQTRGGDDRVEVYAEGEDEEVDFVT